MHLRVAAAAGYDHALGVRPARHTDGVPLFVGLLVPTLLVSDLSVETFSAGPNAQVTLSRNGARPRSRRHPAVGPASFSAERVALVAAPKGCGVQRLAKGCVQRLAKGCVQRLASHRWGAFAALLCRACGSCTCR